LKIAAAIGASRRKLPPWLALLLLCVLIFPVLVFVLGQWITGPYEGHFGVVGFLFSIYRDALQGGLAAWTLLTAPALFVGIWAARNKALRFLPRPKQADQ
jgi:hypothetical protein